MNREPLILERQRMYGTECAGECIPGSECQRTHRLAIIFFQYKQKPLCLIPPR